MCDVQHTLFIIEISDKSNLVRDFGRQTVRCDLLRFPAQRSGLHLSTIEFQPTLCRQACFTGRIENCLVGSDAIASNDQVTLSCSDFSPSCCDHTTGGQLNRITCQGSLCDVQHTLVVIGITDKIQLARCFSLKAVGFNLLRLTC